MAAAIAVAAGLWLYLLPPTPAGSFPSTFSEDEKRQIVSAANADALRAGVTAFFHGRFLDSWHWIVNSRRQTVRAIGSQGDGSIWVHFGIDNPASTDGYDLWARYLMKREHGRWGLAGPAF